MLNSPRLQKITIRFFKFVDKKCKAPCWIWTGGQAGGRRPDQRYGVFRPTWFANDRQKYYAHRVSFVIHKGNIPDDVHILHSCDTPLCINPDHLVKGNPGSNAKDKVLKNRQLKGSDVGNSVLTEKDIPLIKNLYVKGFTQDMISEKFGVSRPNISFILNGKT